MVLESEFLGNSYITRQKRWEISCKLQLTERQVNLHFFSYKIYFVMILGESLVSKSPNEEKKISGKIENNDQK